MNDAPTRHLEMLGIPTDLYGRYADHVELIAQAARAIAPSDATAAGGLARAAGVILDRFGPMRQRNRAAHAAAVARGDTHIDFVLDIPVDVADAMLQFLDAVEELDSLARTGRAPLPAASRDVAAFRRWLIGEAVAQLSGQEPTPFSVRAVRELGT